MMFRMFTLYEDESDLASLGTDTATNTMSRQLTRYSSSKSACFGSTCQTNVISLRNINKRLICRV